MAKNTLAIDLINRDVKDYPASVSRSEDIILILSILLVVIAFLGLLFSGSNEVDVPEVLEYGGELVQDCIQSHPNRELNGKGVKTHDENRTAVLASGLHHRTAVELRQNLYYGHHIS